MSDKAFCEMDQEGRPHIVWKKVVETAVSVLVTVALTVLVNSRVTEYQIEQAQKKNAEQDAEMVRLTREVVELQKQTVGLAAQLASSQKQQDEQQKLLIELLRKR